MSSEFGIVPSIFRRYIIDDIIKGSGWLIADHPFGLFEIWNAARYENVRSSDAVMAHEAFKLME